MAHHPETKPTKSRQTLIHAFSRLVLQRAYADFHVADIIAEADVSRSTFYEHFRNKEDILRQSLTHVLGPLAAAGFDEGDADIVDFVLEHFRDYQSLTTNYLNGPLAPVVEKLLSEMIETRMDKQRLVSNCGLPVQLVSAQMAASTMGIIRAWLNETAPVDSRLVAAQIRAATQALCKLPIEGP